MRLLDVSGREGMPRGWLPLSAGVVMDPMETDDEKCVCPQCHVDLDAELTGLGHC